MTAIIVHGFIVAMIGTLFHESESGDKKAAKRAKATHTTQRYDNNITPRRY